MRDRHTIQAEIGEVAFDWKREMIMIELLLDIRELNLNIWEWIRK